MEALEQSEAREVIELVRQKKLLNCVTTQKSTKSTEKEAEIWSAESLFKKIRQDSDITG